VERNEKELVFVFFFLNQYNLSIISAVVSRFKFWKCVRLPPPSPEKLIFFYLIELKLIYKKIKLELIIGSFRSTDFDKHNLWFHYDGKKN